MIRSAVLKKLALMSALLAFMSACTSVRPMQPPEWASRNVALLELEDWNLRGRMAFKTGNEGGQAKLRWQQVGETSLLRLSGPLGAGAYDLVWAPGRVSVADAKGERSTEYQGADAAEQFLQDQLGWSFPAGSTRYWVMGLLDPAAPGQEQFDAQGSLSGITQHGWNISYQRFVDYDGFALPTRVSMENGNASLRIVISKWSVPAVEG
jgi:outer membrane lipoprotein LolB